MYAVVGCRECEALWVVEGEPETTGCPRCGKRHPFDRLKRFAVTDGKDRARQARAEMLAERSGHGDAFAEIGASGDLDDHLDEAVVEDEEYLEAAGIDADEVETAGERAGVGRGAGRTARPDVVRATLRELDEPTEQEVIAYAAERDVPPDAARSLLERLVRSGEASEDRGRYRLL